MESKVALQDFVSSLLDTQLPLYLTYHNVRHTLYVQEAALEIAVHENCSNADLRLINAAALWHDTGYIETVQGHEAGSCRLARQHLPRFDFSATDIDAICGMIMATRIPQQPRNLLEAIVADADLAYLGGHQVAIQAEDLFSEMQHFNPALTRAAWQHQQVLFLENHRYFTSYCKAEKEKGKQAYLQLLKQGT